MNKSPTQLKRLPNPYESHSFGPEGASRMYGVVGWARSGRSFAQVKQAAIATGVEQSGFMRSGLIDTCRLDAGTAVAVGE